MSKFFALIAVGVGACAMVYVFEGREPEGLIACVVAVLWVICSQLERLIRKGGP